MSSGFRVVYVCSGCWRILAECQGLVSRGRVERHVHDACLVQARIRVLLRNGFGEGLPLKPNNTTVNYTLGGSIQKPPRKQNTLLTTP